MQVRMVIDRFEGEYAVLVAEETVPAVNWPRALLPDATEGDVLQIDIAVDVAATRQAREEAATLLAMIQQRD
ncbi:MAG TPA: DUF3006 domain-containing protein [Patescibacteria group bacterium]|nr:DUF3006 domain-containing protein [Patescibacteria group bacterium]